MCLGVSAGVPEAGGFLWPHEKQFTGKRPRFADDFSPMRFDVSPFFHLQRDAS